MIAINKSTKSVTEKSVEMLALLSDVESTSTEELKAAEAILDKVYPQDG